MRRLLGIAAMTGAIVAFAVLWPMPRIAKEEMAFEGTVLPYPRSTYFFVATDFGKVGVATKDRAIHVEAGARVRIEGTATSSYSGKFGRWLRGEGAVAWVYPRVVQVLEKPSFLFRVLNAIRARVEGKLPPVGAAMLLSERSKVPWIQRADELGISHLFAASGLHLSLLISLLSLVLPRKWRWLGLLAGGAFVALTARISMMRAWLMAGMTFLPFGLRPFERLLLALAVILVISPYAVYSLSLQLSFLSTACVIVAAYVVPRLMVVTRAVFLREPLRTVVRYLLHIAVASTMCASAAVVFVGPRNPFASAGANMVAIPAGTAILALSFVSVLLPWPLYLVPNALIELIEKGLTAIIL